MMITPRVVRTRAESVVVTDEFISKLGAVRTELERMARDQEKMRPKPAPDQAPPMPVPPPANDPAPNSTPTPALPPGRGASIAPLTDNRRGAGKSRGGTARGSDCRFRLPLPRIRAQQLNRPMDPVEARPMVSSNEPSAGADRACLCSVRCQTKR